MLCKRHYVTSFYKLSQAIIFVFAIYGAITMLAQLLSSRVINLSNTSTSCTKSNSLSNLSLQNSSNGLSENVTHCTIYNFLKRTDRHQLKKYEPISLVLHSTINYAHYIIKQSTTWDDIISYAIFIVPGHEAALSTLVKLHYCHRLTRSKVSIHLVWNKGLFQRQCNVKSILKLVSPQSINNITCDNFSIDEVKLKLSKFNLGFANYPINIMRNEARRGATSKLHLVGDIETQWSYNFTLNVRSVTQKLLNNKYGKAVLVYRRFEQDFDSPFPENVKNLAQQLKKRKVVQFHEKYFQRGHIIPNLGLWVSYSLNHEHILLRNLSYLRYEWEPQFIMRHDAPFHYEHTATRFFDHQFLCYELCRAEYSFLLMTHVFNIHPGIKTDNSVFEKAVDAYGREHSHSAMRNFATFLNNKYPIPIGTSRKCPEWKNFF